MVALQKIQYEPNRPDPPPRLGPNAEDGEWVSRALRGDRWAEEALYRKHVRRVTAMAYRMVGDRAEAEDVVQETFLRAFSQLSRLSEGAAFGGWIVRIALRRIQRRYRRARLLRILGFTSEGDLPLDSLTSADPSPEEHEELRRVDRALRELSARERSAWVLRCVEGYKLAEVANLCDCSLATAKRRIEAAQIRIDRHVGRTR